MWKVTRLNLLPREIVKEPTRLHQPSQKTWLPIRTLQWEWLGEPVLFWVEGFWVGGHLGPFLHSHSTIGEQAVEIPDRAALHKPWLSARHPSRAPSLPDLAVCDSVRESGNLCVPFWYLSFSGTQFKVLFVGIFSPAPSSILPSDFSSTVFFRLVEIYSDSHCTVDLHYFAATWVTTILKVIRRKEEESDLVPGGMSITFFKSMLLILRVRLRVS